MKSSESKGEISKDYGHKKKGDIFINLYKSLNYSSNIIQIIHMNIWKYSTCHGKQNDILEFFKFR